MAFHADEDYIGINGIFAEHNDLFSFDEARNEVKEFLSKFYTWDNECEEFDETEPKNSRKYEITIKREDECCDDTYATIFHLEIALPTDEDAKELADIIDGTVVSGLNADGKEFCITYTKKIVIKAKNKDEAKKLFNEMNMQYADSCSEFGKISSIVGTTEKKTTKPNK